MRPLRVVIVDDEPLARMRLASLVADAAQPRCEVAAELANAAQALDWLRSHTCDVLLLDVQMPGLSGTALAQSLQERHGAPAVVFVSAHAEHALKAFELDAVDYLSKPVRRERLQQALLRVVQRLGASHPGDGAVPAAPPAQDEPALLVSERGRLQRVPLSQVLFLKAELKYVTLRTAQHEYLLDESLTELEPRLADRFIRIHRNALVARCAVRRLERRRSSCGDGGEEWAVEVAPIGEWLTVSRRQVAFVREALEADSL